LRAAIAVMPMTPQHPTCEWTVGLIGTVLTATALAPARRTRGSGS
jgi:hypothetical protein